MSVILEQPVTRKASWLHVFWPDSPHEKAEGRDRRTERQDRAEQDPMEAEKFWAGRTLASRRSARVAA